MRTAECRPGTWAWSRAGDEGRYHLDVAGGIANHRADRRVLDVTDFCIGFRLQDEEVGPHLLGDEHVVG